MMTIIKAAAYERWSWQNPSCFGKLCVQHDVRWRETTPGLTREGDAEEADVLRDSACAS